MDVYIKDKRSFALKTKLNCYAHNAVQSIFDSNSSFSVISDDSDISEGDFLISLDLNFICIIDLVKTTIGSKEVELTCSQVVNLFSRKLLTEGEIQISTSVEGFIKAQIEKHFSTLTDNYFRLPFIIATNTTDTPSTMIINYDADLWSLKSFITKAQRLNDIQLDYSLDGNNLAIGISKATNTAVQLDFTDPRLTLEVETLSQKYIAKIEIYCTENSLTTYYYKLSDGTYTTDSTNTKRIIGEWETIVVDTIDAVADKVADTFATNTYSHLIEFSVEKDSYYNDELTFYRNADIKLKNGTVVTSYITEIARNSEDNLIHYKSGELRTKLTDKLLKGGIL